ncbi:hypothetical protein WR25_20998 [Diploscapter pachys]|uniref:Uncharacterized protein n=1 Tax=Diploscapter pachys TaxID=2018661 RepID=A0A2A2K3X7_9BILA|nr:hypothetical protein WR25_20998 [Diploscapter pachys]
MRGPSDDRPSAAAIALSATSFNSKPETCGTAGAPARGGRAIVAGVAAVAGMPLDGAVDSPTRAVAVPANPCAASISFAPAAGLLRANHLRRPSL